MRVCCRLQSLEASSEMKGCRLSLLLSIYQRVVCMSEDETKSSCSRMIVIIVLGPSLLSSDEVEAASKNIAGSGIYSSKYPNTSFCQSIPASRHYIVPLRQIWQTCMLYFSLLSSLLLQTSPLHRSSTLGFRPCSFVKMMANPLAPMTMVR